MTMGVQKLRIFDGGWNENLETFKLNVIFKADLINLRRRIFKMPKISVEKSSRDIDITRRL